MPVLERSAVLPFFLKTALLLAATAVCVTAVLVANLLHLPKGWLFVLPGLVVFVLTLGFGFYRINKFRRQARVANLAPSHWFAQGIFLFVVTLVLIVVLDGVWFLIDSSLAHAYAAALAEAKVYLPAQTGEEPAFPGIFNRLPVMVQALLPVIAGGVAGSLPAACLAHKYTS